MKKIIGIFICIMLIGTALPTLGTITKTQTINEYELDNYYDYEYVPGEFIVKFKEPPSLKIKVENLNDKYNVISMDKMFNDVENTPLDNIYKIYVPINSDILSIVDEYDSMSSVEYAEPNYIIKLDLTPINSQKSCSLDLDKLKTSLTPNDPLFDQQLNLENTGQYDGTPGADINALEAWDIETGSDEVVIAILDTGVDYTHPDLVDNIWINEDEIPDNDIDDDNNGYVDDAHGYDFSNLENDEIPLDVYGHGTFCAGIAAAVTNNGVGIAGVTWNCKIMCIQVLDKYQTMRTDFWANGVKYAADNDADILSMSYGLDDFALIRDAYEYAYEKGAILIAAAGNSNTSKTRYFHPAAYDFVIGVAATNQRDERCDGDDWGSPYGSNFGYWVDVAAPANNFIGTTPTYNVTWNDDGREKTYAYIEGGGTSWATPTVAGIAALLLSQDPTLTNDEIRRIIRANVDPYISEEYIGTGRVNAYKALTRFNTQPETPDTPSGKTNGKPGKEYKFTTIASDEDVDELWYFWDWGDGNYSSWLGPYASGDECEASYTWQQEANFSIKVKVKDGKGGESYWSEPFVFSTPKNKAINTPLFLQMFFQRLPLFEKILNQITL